LFEGSVRLVTLQFGSHIYNTGLIEVFNISMYVRLHIPIVNKLQYFILPIMTGKNVVIVIPRNSCMEVVC